MSVRTRISLDGPWDFQIDPGAHQAVSAIESWRTAQVPMPWQAQFADLRHTSGVGWYRRTFSLEERPDEETQSAILHFGAVDYHAELWINGNRVGEHEGGYLPFTFDVTTLLKRGDNEIVVRVADPTDDTERWPMYPFSEIPHGKQSWYGPISGIWQSVWLELCSATYIQQLRLTPDPAAGTIGCHATISGHRKRDIRIQYRISGPNDALLEFDVDSTQVDSTQVDSTQVDSTDVDSKQVDSTQVDSTDIDSTQVDSTQVDSTNDSIVLREPPILWSPETPALYTVTAQLFENEQLLDERSATCGFRTVAAKDGRIYLNGEPIYLRGALDQAYYPETIYTPPSLAFLEDQVRKAKALGLNCLRCHIKIEDPRYYEVADRLGILIWTEIPNWIHLSAGASQRVKETFLRMVERDWNHPSIIAWTLVNENWGTDLARNPEHRHWLAGFYHEAKQIDPHRLVVDNSACRGNLHVAGDLEDFHEYRAIPDHAHDWDVWVAEFAGRADWAWADDYAHERRADLPLVVSEFGNWGLPDPAAIMEAGTDPWWFENGLEWGDGIVYPHGMRARYYYWGLDKLFGDLATFTQAHQAHMARSLAYEITTMRLQTAIAGYVITEFTDVHWECNGLMDMQRNVKAGLDAHFVPLNQDQVVVARPQRWSGRPGTTVPVEVRALGVDGAGSSGTIRWQAGTQQGTLAAPGATVAITLEQPGMVGVAYQWEDGAGTVLAEGELALACVAPSVSAVKLNVIDDEQLATTLSDLGYRVTTDRGAVLVATRYTQAVQTAVQEGAMLLLIVSPASIAAADSLTLPTCRPITRTGTGWQGDWATSFSWLRKEGSFAGLPGGPLLAMEYAAIMPDVVLDGIPARAFPDASWAGLALGWIHKPVSLLHKAPYGNGEIVTTTFKLTAENLRDNVVAQALFDGCLRLLG